MSNTSSDESGGASGPEWPPLATAGQQSPHSGTRPHTRRAPAVASVVLGLVAAGGLITAMSGNSSQGRSLPATTHPASNPPAATTTLPAYLGSDPVPTNLPETACSKFQGEAPDAAGWANGICWITSNELAVLSGGDSAASLMSAGTEEGCFSGYHGPGLSKQVYSFAAWDGSCWSVVILEQDVT